MLGNQTVDRIHDVKRTARLLKKQQPMKHATALELAAKQSGYQSFRQAQNESKTSRRIASADGGSVSTRFSVTISQFWVDSELGIRGKETLEIKLSRPLDTIASLNTLKKARGLRKLVLFGPSRFEMEYASPNQQQARESLYLADRTLTFMDATGLLPSSGDRHARPKGQWSVPGEDHARSWYDPVTRRYLLLDEPYQRSIYEKMPKRLEWLKEFGYVMKYPDWFGMYNPYMDADNGSRLYLITHGTKGVDLDKIVSRLNRLPQPIGKQPWAGVSMQPVPMHQ